ncbi:MAG: sodium/proton-translocating pyrophosphatase, partial [Candidatus Margulisbacteria bacterium]|nr:sodium/proton-translocating pyrophosphatase [Candidatus Margulisiibacteriota bacterium]
MELWILLVGFLGLVYALYLFWSVTKMQPGSARMQEIAASIHEGAMTYLRRQYLSLLVFMAIVFIAILAFIGLPIALAYLSGGLFSMLAGYIGMSAATRANVRTAHAASTYNQGKSLGTAFKGGAVMGMSIASLGIIGLGLIWFLIPDLKTKALVVSGFSMGASSIALFARVG